ncbi:glycosyltransferase family 2 protein [Verrucomicrobium spinosum]|uniref:glycosyltransferase family 2 protein n=1 Tax=Verrucomicrobium spinosum TaxID=2736 RepID=UPI00017462F0|nr:glycosyltransferase family A protein [Verrucomicrobium spinosum]
MKVSLLIPAYQAANFLPDIISDARAQEKPFDEILVYDDASTDETIAVAEALGANVIEGKVNRGAAFARNRLLEAASCPWIHFHDADDRLDPAYLSTVSKLNPSGNEIVLCGLKMFDSQSGKYGQEFHWMQLNGCSDLGTYLACQFQMGSGLYPAALLRSIGGFREDLRGAEDHEIHIRLFLAGARFRTIPSPLNVYCRHGGITFTETQPEQLNSDWLKVYKSYMGAIPPAHHDVLASMFMELAYKCHAQRQFSETDEAIKLANALGRDSVVSSSRLLRMVSRFTGAKMVFRFRSIWNRFRAT